MGRAGSDATQLPGFTRVVEDRIEVVEVFDEATMVAFTPAPVSGRLQKEQVFFFVENDVLAEAAKKDDPVEFLTSDKVRSYVLMPKDGPDFFNTDCFEVHLGQNGYSLFNESQLEILDQDGFDKERLLHVRWRDHMLFRFGSDIPPSRLHLIDFGLNETEFYLDKALAIVEAHPWVVKAWPDNGRRVGNPNGINMIVKLPEDEYRKLLEALLAREKGKTKTISDVYVSGFELSMALVCVATVEDAADSPQHYPFGPDPLGLAPAKKPEYDGSYHDDFF